MGFTIGTDEIWIKHPTVSFKKKIFAVGIYGEGEEEQREAFEQVVADINRDANLLKKTLLKADTIHNVNQKNAYTLKEKCKIILVQSTRSRIPDV